MPNAIIDQVADDCVTLIGQGWTPGPTDTLAAVDLPFAELESITGITVWIFAADYADNGMADRSEFEEDYTVAITIMVPFAGQGDPTQTWIRTQRAFVEQKIFNVLKDPRTVQLAVTFPSGATGYLWPERVDVVQAYDPVLLRSHKLFWCDLEVTFRGNLPGN